MKRHGLAVIGLGLAVAPHARALAELESRATVRWAASRSEARCAAFARNSSWPVTTDIDAAITDPTVDIVLILTPPASHLELARRAFAAGKHVLIEKPLALTSAQAAEIVQLGRHAGRRLGVVLQHRFRPNALRLRSQLAQGALGTVELASATIPWWRPQGYYDEPGRGSMARDGGGVLLTQGIHTLDLFRSLIGPVLDVAGVARTTSLHRMETEDAAGAVMRLARGGFATMMATTAAYPGHQETIHLVCSKGTATLTGNDLRIDFIDGSQDIVSGDSGSGGGADPMEFSHGPHKALIADMLDAVEQGRDPQVDGEGALETQRLIDAVLEASHQQMWVAPART